MLGKLPENRLCHNGGVKWKHRKTKREGADVDPKRGKGCSSQVEEGDRVPTVSPDGQQCARPA